MKNKKGKFVSYGEVLHVYKSANSTKCGIVNKWKHYSELRPQIGAKWTKFYCIECFPNKDYRPKNK